MALAVALYLGEPIGLEGARLVTRAKLGGRFLGGDLGGDPLDGRGKGLTAAGGERGGAFFGGGIGAFFFGERGGAGLGRHFAGAPVAVDLALD